MINCKDVDFDDDIGESAVAKRGTDAEIIIRDMRQWSHVSEEELSGLRELLLHSDNVHKALYYVVGSALAFTRRCAYHRRIRSDWCRPLLVADSQDMTAVEVLTAMTDRLHQEGNDVCVADLLHAVEDEVRTTIVGTLRERGIELAGPDVFSK